MQILLLTALIAGMVAAAPTTMTLDQAKSYALEHSRSLAINQLEVEQARTQVDAALANCYPTVGLQGSYAYLSNVSVLSMPLGSGGSMITIPLGSHANYDAKIALSQTLYSGGRISNGYKAAQIGVNIAQDSIARSRQELAYSVESAFNTILLTRELLKLTQQSLDRAQDHLKVLITLRDQGFVSQYDSLRTAVQVDNLTPQITRLQDAIRLALEAFKLTISMPMDSTVDVTGQLELNDYPISESEAIAEALANRIELKQLNEGKQALYLVRRIIQGNYCPAVGASAAYDLQRPTGLGATGWGPSLTLALGLKYTLFDGLATRAQLRQTDLQIRQLELTEDLARDGISLEVKEALISMQSSKASADVCGCNVEAAQAGVKLAETRYAEGHGSNLDVLDAQLALFQAQVNNLSAIKDYDDARARLIKAIGKEQ